MRWSSVLSTLAAVVAVGLCAAAVVAIGNTAQPRADTDATPISSATTSIPAQPSRPEPYDAPAHIVIRASGSSAETGRPAAAKPTHTPSPAKPPNTTAPTKAFTSRPTTAVTGDPAPGPIRGRSLPLGYSTGAATEIITVTARSTSSTTAVLQAWDKALGGGWLPHGGAITAHIGADGMTTHPRESLSATPIGSYGLSRAFGADANPGTSLPYHQTTSADWWISQSGSLYNTMQTCSGSCPFAQGDPNEHLHDETPFYNYAVVIEYNTAAPIEQGAGSAFFLHVTDGTATAGCVAIPPSNLVSIMKWLSPSGHARILIGVG